MKLLRPEREQANASAAGAEVLDEEQDIEQIVNQVNQNEESPSQFDQCGQQLAQMKQELATVQLQKDKEQKEIDKLIHLKNRLEGIEGLIKEKTRWEKECKNE